MTEHDDPNPTAPAAPRQGLGWMIKMLVAGATALRAGSDETEWLVAVCEAITRNDDYPLAWIGWAQHDERRSVRIEASAGAATGYLQGMQLSWDDSPVGAGPTGRCLRERRTVVNNHALTSDPFKPWQMRARTLGLHASVALPLVTEAGPVGTLCVYSRRTDAFSAEEVELLEALCQYLVSGLDARRLRLSQARIQQEQGQSEQRLVQVFHDALAALSSLLGQRDPYTVDHQNDVADLAVRIGQDMQLSPERLDVLRMAAQVHDVGKIQVPAELLNKPLRLSEEEMALVRLHPGVGHALISALHCPWPVADIVHQHHECMDGSGYPLGLRADQILLESRILAVADIVESISADRPYRPAMGFPPAIQEIQRCRGNKLDSEVVDAALRVLARGDYVPYVLGRGVVHVDA